MKRIGILTAGGDTPALNATVFGAVTRANQLRVEVIGLLSGFDSLYDQRLPHVLLNPLFRTIPELDPDYGGTVLGSSRRYVDPGEGHLLDQMIDRMGKLGVEGLICVGGDGTLNGLQPLCDRIPTVLAPKTIDNDLGLNFASEPDKWYREEAPGTPEGHVYRERASSLATTPVFHLEQMVNYATPGYATAVFVCVGGVRRIRTTAESHRRIAIIEVMGRHSGYLALGSAYGQPDIVLVPESPVEVDRVVERVRELYYLQRNVLIVCGEGIVGPNGEVLGDEEHSTDPAGNVRLSGAAESLRSLLVNELGDGFFQRLGHNDSASSAVFTRKVGHTQRGGRPVGFDRFYASMLGGKALEILLEGQNNAVATLQWSREEGFYVSSFDGNGFRDRYGLIHARSLHPSFYDPVRMHVAQTGVDYLLPIFTNCIGPEDVTFIRETRFDSGNLFRNYHSVNTDIAKRTRFLQ